MRVQVEIEALGPLRYVSDVCEERSRVQDILVRDTNRLPLIINSQMHWSREYRLPLQNI